MYREPGAKDVYVIDERPIIKREFKMPEMLERTKGIILAATAPVVSGLVFTFFPSYLALDIGVAVGCAVLSIYGIAKAIVDE